MLLTAAAVWVAIAAPVAVVVGRAIRRADVAARLTRVPQLDVPLWRGTDLDPEWQRCPECRAMCAPNQWACDRCGAGLDDPDDDPPAGALDPLDDYPRAAGTYVVDAVVDEHLAGAILGLAFATDEDGARYWLAQCARRGADADTLRDLRAEWDRQHAADVQTLHTDREDPRP